MARTQRDSFIKLRGVRQNNLKHFDLDLPLGKLIVITGLSGSGKSSLAFDTLYAEGQRRYIETFTPYARQFFDRMDKPQVDRIEGIPPAIAIEQRNTVKTTRSTIGTMTEICDHTKVLWATKASLFCRGCGEPVIAEDPQTLWQIWSAKRPGEPVLITFEVPTSKDWGLENALHLIAQQGYTRLLIQGRITPLESALEALQGPFPEHLCVIQDRMMLKSSQRPRFIEACEVAYQFGKGYLKVHQMSEDRRSLLKTQNHSMARHCAACEQDYSEPSASLFSFNHPAGACPECRGFGRVITIDYDLAIPDHRLSLEEGAVRPWQTGQGVACQKDLLQFCRRRKIPTRKPFESLTPTQQTWVIQGDPDYGTDTDHQWPKAWYGVKGYFDWLESKSYKMHVRVLLSRYRSYQLCPECQGARLQPESLNYRMPLPGKASSWIDLPGFYRLPLNEALEAVQGWQKTFRPKKTEPLGMVLEEMSSRLSFMVDVGLEYLSLDRPTRSLSGGETERVNLTRCLGSRLVHTLYVLDEPSVGLHPRDTDRLIHLLKALRDHENTVVVVEHESSMMEEADEIIDIGPGHGKSGGSLMFQGPPSKLKRHKASLTGQYLGGHRTIDAFKGRSKPSKGKDRWLKLRGATKHNLQNLSVDIPLHRLVCVTGVSGSGKTTLVRDVLIPQLKDSLHSDLPSEKRFEDDDGETSNGGLQGASTTRLSGEKGIHETVLVDQSPIGRTPRSNPAVYIGAFDAIRDLFARSEQALDRDFTSGHFSFNSKAGQCQHCKGVGFEKIEMQFLSDVFIRCPECHGRRYRSVVLEVTLREPTGGSQAREWSIADLLEATIDEALDFLHHWKDTRPAQKAMDGLQWLQKAGLGYLQLGQPIHTLSGGESQRLKLVKHLAAISTKRAQLAHCLYVFDEPTTGLHFEDVRILLDLFQDLVDSGHSVIMIEHHIDVIRSADWVIDLGPEGGCKGGMLVACGPPSAIMKCKESHTGRALLQSLKTHASSDPQIRARSNKSMPNGPRRKRAARSGSPA